jgi:uncharacterized protein YndB with AHSA1/START domain
MNQSIKMDVFYPHPPERVWQVLTDRRALAAWMMENDFEPRLGHKFKFQNHGLPGLETAIDCEVVELDEPKRLAYTWQDNSTCERSLVIWTLTPVEGGTQLQLKHHERSYVVAVGQRSPVGSRGWAGETVDSNASGGLEMRLQLTRETAFLREYRLLEPQLVKEARFLSQEWEYRLKQKLPQVLLRCDINI